MVARSACGPGAPAPALGGAPYKEFIHVYRTERFLLRGKISPAAEALDRAERVSDAPVGFHAQQAVEKALKGRNRESR
jgi:hypothetical protein